MKTIFTVIVFAGILTIQMSGFGQNQARFPKIHERILQAKLREIRFQLNLDQAKFEAFRPLYLKYEREISSVNFRDLARLNRVDADSLSTEEADQLITNQIEAAKKMLVVREKYAREFRTVLSPQQIVKLYQTEAEIRKKVTQELKRRVMSR